MVEKSQIFLNGQVSLSSEETPSARVPSHINVESLRYDNIDVSLERDAGTFWCYMRPQKPVVTNALLDDLLAIQGSLRTLFSGREVPFTHFVFASRSPGIYSLGGDLQYFTECVRTGNRASIHAYARACVEVVYGNVNAFDLPVITMALVQGDALGGGFETALSFDVIVAERSAKMGLPEIYFNLFPGMGAYSFLSRRLDRVRAERMIMSGQIYTAEELHDMGIVDVLAEDGQGEAALCEYIEKSAPKHNAHLGLYQMRRRVNPVTLDELQDVVDHWVDAVFRVGEADLRKMARLTAAQDRRLGRVAANQMIAAE